MKDKHNQLAILWTNADPMVSEMMVFMYAESAMINHWWEKISIIVWGATTKLVVEDIDIQNKLIGLQSKGVHISCCQTCAERLHVKEDLLNLNLEVKRWGEDLTNLLKENTKVLSI